MIPPEWSAVLFILVAASFIVAALLKFARGVDGFYSVTNVQIILWTGVVLGGYLSLALLKGNFLDNIPTNLLYLMGISVGSAVAATGIRSIQQPNLPTKKEFNGTEKLTLKNSGLFNSEKAQGELSVAKIQMMAWTAVSLAIFIYLLLSNILSSNPTFPDVETGLLTLMGVSHAGYNGNKIFDKPE